jgi:hypothetical protein
MAGRIRWTPPAGLTYALKIGTTPGAENIMGANTSGKRKVSEKEM